MRWSSAAVAFLLAGCAGPGGFDLVHDAVGATPDVTLLGTCRWATDELGGQVAHILNVSVRNGGDGAYSFDDQHWTLADGKGRTAWLAGFVNVDGRDPEATLQPGDSSTWVLILFQSGADQGNLTSIAFQQRQPVPLEPAAPLPPLAGTPCWGTYDWRGHYAAAPWG